MWNTEPAFSLGIDSLEENLTIFLNTKKLKGIVHRKTSQGSKESIAGQKYKVHYPWHLCVVEATEEPGIKCL